MSPPEPVTILMVISDVGLVTSETKSTWNLEHRVVKNGRHGNGTLLQQKWETKMADSTC